MEEKIRQVAYKLWVSDIVNSEFVKTSGDWEPNYINFRGKKVSRVNIIVAVVGKILQDTYAVLDLDDSSGTLSARAWNEDMKLFQGVEVGDFVLVVGKVKDYNGKIYVVPELVRKMDADWMKLRKLELMKLYGQTRRVEVAVASSKNRRSEEVLVSEEFIEEEVVENVSVDSRGKVISLLSSAKDGLSVSVLREKVSDLDKILPEMINEGEVFKVGDIVRVMG